MTRSTEQLLRTVHALHGHAILAARDADTDDRRRELFAEAHAFEIVLAAIEDDWQPFDEDGLQSQYRQVSEGVLEADRQNADDRNHDIGLQ